jgi:MerR family transcriptional regulator/heat shock protein HspR
MVSWGSVRESAPQRVEEQSPRPAAVGVRCRSGPGEFVRSEFVRLRCPNALDFDERQQNMATKRKSRGAYMISAVAEMYEIHPQTLRLYEREGLLRPSRSEGNTRLYTDEDLERLEFILNLARDLGVNIAGIAIVLQMRERMEEMNRQMQGFVDFVRSEMVSRMQPQDPGAGLVPLRRPVIVPVKPAAKTVNNNRKK